MSAGNNCQNAVYARSEKVIRRDVGGETVLVPVAASGAADLEYLYRMNAVGAAVWDLLDGRRTITEIAGEIRVAFDTSGAKQAAGLRLETGGTETEECTTYSQLPHSRQNPGESAASKVEEDIRTFLADLEEAKLVSRRL